MKRLFNEYGAAVGDDARALDDTIDKSIDDIVAKVKELGLDYRDCYGYVVMSVSNRFAEASLRFAFNKKKEEQNKL